MTILFQRFKENIYCRRSFRETHCKVECETMKNKRKLTVEHQIKCRIWKTFLFVSPSFHFIYKMQFPLGLSCPILSHAFQKRVVADIQNIREHVYFASKLFTFGQSYGQQTDKPQLLEFYYLWKGFQILVLFMPKKKIHINPLPSSVKQEDLKLPPIIPPIKSIVGGFYFRLLITPVKTRLTPQIRGRISIF